MNSWKIILATVVIFGCGVGTGGLLVGYVEHAFPEIRRPFNGPQILNQQLVKRLDATLHLTPEQREKIEKIIADGQERNRDLWKLVAPQFHAVTQDVHQHIRAVLTPEQRRQFEELMKQITPHRPLAPTNTPPALPLTNAPSGAPSSPPAPGA